jgi:hypothetical protein
MAHVMEPAASTRWNSQRMSVATAAAVGPPGQPPAHPAAPAFGPGHSGAHQDRPLAVGVNGACRVPVVLYVG